MYRWLAYDLMSGDALEELPLSGPQFGAQLGGIGDFRAALLIPSTNATRAAALTAATIPERTIIFPERDGVLVGDGYIVWRRVRSGKVPCSLQGASLASIMRRERIVSDLTYTATDQLTIAKALVDHMQAQPGADFGIVVPAVTCGVTRDRTFYAYERKNLGDALAQLAAVDDGFEWAIDVAWSTGADPSPVCTLNLSYPRRGRIAGSTGLVFELGKNIIDYSILEDGTRSARSVDFLGAGDGADMLIATVTRTEYLDAGWPLTSEVIAAKDITVADTLSAHAREAVDARAATPQFLDVQIDPGDPDAGFGQWITGDDVLVRISDHQFPATSAGPGLQAYYRIVAWKMAVDDNGAETLQVTLGSIS